MDVFDEFLAHISNAQNKARTEEVLLWVTATFPDLVPKIAWNQPMFTDHGTFIIAFSVAKQHLAVAPEKAGIRRFADDIALAGYDHGSDLMRIRWDKPVDYTLLEKMIRFNMEDKADCSTFWRK